MGAHPSKDEPPSAMPPCSAGQEAFKANQSQTSDCPVPEELRRPAVYNVYNQRIDGSGGASSSAPDAAMLDPKNNMPLVPNQQPFPGQRKLISTAREESTIPKGGTDSTWTYPSPQMFYNALMRKGKGEDITEDVMDSVVFTHNSMNELTWAKVQQWERLHPESAGSAKLSRFLGRPHDLSPLARLRTLLGGPAPFDRHDWYLERDGQEVRYVIDFYFDDSLAGSPEAFDLEVRPALDSAESALDRLKMATYIQCAKWGLPCPISGDLGNIVSGAATSDQPAT